MRPTGNLSSTLKLAKAICVCLFCAAMMVSSPAQTLTPLHSFNGSDGMNPYRAALVQGIDGNFYGTTEMGGTDNYGVVFRMTPDGTVTVLHQFVGSDGTWPSSGLIQDAAGNLYGTTRGGGPGPNPGVVYKITPQGSFSILTAAGGAALYAPLLLASDGNLYGVSTNGGAPGYGTAFKVGTDGSNLQILHTFCTIANCPDGENPLGGLAEGPDHSVYGTTEYGGANGDYGVVFQLTPAGVYTVLHSFSGSTDGNTPRGRLLLASDGYLYGTTASGGSGGAGTIFKIRPDGSNFTVVYTFCPNHNCTVGGTPESGLIEASDGNFYGTNLYGHGFLYKLTPSGTVTALYTFCPSGGNCSDGSYPYGELLQANDGNFYGANRYGGTDGDGTVFRFSGPGLIATTTTLTSTPNPSQLNQTVTMTATVQAQSGTPLGNVVFSSDGVQIGTVALSNGVAVLNDSSLAVGTHALLAAYQGGNGDAGSTSNTVEQVVQLSLSTTNVASAPNPSISGQAVTITASVGPSGPPVPSGTVSFTSNGTAIPDCTAVPLSSSIAVCMTSALQVGTDTLVAAYSGDNNYAPSSGSLTQIVNPAPVALQFVAATPCRLVDTRNPSGTFGGPAISGNSSRSFPLSEGDNPCGIPSNAVAYSLNVTVVPHRTLGYLTIWPTGEGQPVVSTLNSSDGRVKANAAIVPAGTPSGSVSVYVTDTTNVILDINGYFVPNSSSTLAFYPLMPCRVMDTRDSHQPSGLGPPHLGDGETRELPILSSPCLQGLPNQPLAYSLNVTVVPNPGGPLNYLTVWPSNQQQPFVSTLNNPTATVVANAAIVPADPATGDIDVFAYNSTDVVMDVNGYFATPGAGGLSFYPLTPCRTYDSRNNHGQPFSGERTVDVVDSPCGPPSSAQGYVFNATVVPSHSLGYLTLWPDTEMQPEVSTLNAYDGLITSNMAIVPNINGSIDAYAAAPTHLILDISGHFAP